MLARTARALPTLAAAAALALALPAAARAGTVVGSDLSGAPSASCVDAGVGAFNDCTLTQLDANAYTIPAAGVITRWTLKHGPELGADIPVAALRILTPTGAADTYSARMPGGTSGLAGAGGTDTFTFSDDVNRPKGVPVSAGDRIGVYVNDAALATVAAGPGQAGAVVGSHGSGTRTYQPTAGALLLQAVVEPDADGDGYGDESQDACPQVAGPAACPTPQPPSTEPPAGGQPATAGPGGPGGPGAPGGGDIPFFVAETIEAFHAEPVGIYRAATIRRLPARVNLYDAVLRGFSQPIRCSLACRITTAATMRGISASLYAMMSRSRTVRVGSSSGAFPTAGSGRLRVKLTAKARRALRRYGRTVRVTLRTTVDDGREKVVRTQTITLKVKPRHR